jgi:ribosomal protein S18 acetylase RimI-like enzyme
MNTIIRPIRETDIDAVIELSILAWSPIHSSFRTILGTDIYESIWPDWKAEWRNDIPLLPMRDREIITYVAECDSVVVGFVSFKIDKERKEGRLQGVAVHPDYQCKGIGTELNVYALDRMKDCGMKMAIAETGGEESHLPARISYEKAGYTGLPLVRYFKLL